MGFVTRSRAVFLSSSSVRLQTQAGKVAPEVLAQQTYDYSCGLTNAGVFGGLRAALGL